MSDEMDAIWFGEPMRWLHLNLVGAEVAAVDVPAWSAYWADVRAEGVTISAAGAVAFYPTDVPDHPRAGGTSERDLFGELCHAAKALGMRVLARFEPTNIGAEQVDAHPEWVVRNADGTPRSTRDPMAVGIRDNLADASIFAAAAGPDRFAPCVNGPYFREFMPAVMTELAERYPIDGFYANGWPRLGAGPPQEGTVCHCTACEQDWKSRSAEHNSFPDSADGGLWDEYIAFVQDTVEDVQRSWQAHIQSLRPELTFVCNLFGSLASGLRWERFRELVDVFVHDGQGRSPIGPTTTGPAANALWGAARGAQLVRAAAGPDHQVFHAVGAWHTGQPPLRRVSKEPRELTQMLAQVVAKGARPYCNVAGGVVHDRRWTAPLRDYYQWHARNERYLGHGSSLADVAVVWAPSSAWLPWSTRRRDAGGPSLANAFNGWHLAFLEARVPYDVVPDFDVAETDLSRFRAIVVPSGTALRDAAAQALASFAANGGGLVLGCGTLSGPGASAAEVLRSAVGLPAPAELRGPAANAYIALAAEGRSDPLLTGVGDTDFLAAGHWTASIETPPPGATGVGTLRDPLPFLADRADWTDPQDERPALCRRGRCVYLGTDLDALFGSTMLPDGGRLLANTLAVAVDGRSEACTVVGPGLVDVNAWQVAAGVTVHLVNHSNERLYGGPLTSFRPVGRQEVRVRVPAGATVTGARLLRSSHEAAWLVDDDIVEVSVDGLTDFEVVAIELDRHTAGQSGH